LLCLDKHSTGDGTISALQVLAAIQRSGRSLDQLLEGLVLYPQEMINVKIAAGMDWQRHAGLQAARSEAEQRLAGQGRVLIRASGTEPVLRVMVEAADGKLAKECAQAMASSIVQ
jgi:phosphoglucosamine mutase